MLVDMLQDGLQDLMRVAQEVLDGSGLGGYDLRASWNRCIVAADDGSVVSVASISKLDQRLHPVRD